jgi:hypothetical protein
MLANGRVDRASDSTIVCLIPRERVPPATCDGWLDDELPQTRATIDADGRFELRADADQLKAMGDFYVATITASRWEFHGLCQQKIIRARLIEADAKTRIWLGLSGDPIAGLRLAPTEECEWTNVP